MVIGKNFEAFSYAKDKKLPVFNERLDSLNDSRLACVKDSYYAFPRKMNFKLNGLRGGEMRNYSLNVNSIGIQT